MHNCECAPHILAEDTLHRLNHDIAEGIKLVQLPALIYTMLTRAKELASACS